MKTYTVNAQLFIQAEDELTRAEILADLRKKLATLQEEKPYRREDGASWWTASRPEPRVTFGIGKGTKVRLVSPPGTKVPYGAIGTAGEAPGAGGLFWAVFPQGRMHTRVSEVEIADA